MLLFFNVLPWTCLSDHSLSHTRLVHFSQIALVYSRRSERTGRSSILQPLCEIFKFFLGVLLQDPASKVSFWTLLAFTLFQSPHICFFSESPALQFLFKLLCLVSMVCIRLLLLPLVRLLFLQTCAHVNLCWSFDVVLWISHSLHLLNFRNCLTGFDQNV